MSQRLAKMKRSRLVSIMSCNPIGSRPSRPRQPLRGKAHKGQDPRGLKPSAESDVGTAQKAGLAFRAFSFRAPPPTIKGIDHLVEASMRPTLRSFALALGLVAGFAAGAHAADPRALTLGTASTGGTYAIYGGVMATLLTEQIKIPVSTQQTQGPNQNILLLESKDIDLGMTTMGVALQAWNGEGAWTQGRKMRNVRALFPMYDTPFHFMVTEKSGIKSVAELQGKSVGVGPAAGTPGTYFPLMFEALGIKVTIRNGQASDMANQLGDGLIGAFAFAAGVPIAAFTEIEAQRPVRFISFTDQEIATLKQKMPELSDSMIPKATYKSMPGDQKTIGLYNFAIAHKDLSADVAYRVVKAVLDNNAQMVKGHAASVETIAANWNRNAFLPFHPGAVKYFQEKGITIPQNLR
ncbi:MAG: TAXI family TRAP transporter solute-binding subunit [Alphaproteobacteria bacterium]|nr:TAXI family TRAP transporter solute-binding subunit [Alphaproteobacteria bacterium]